MGLRNKLEQLYARIPPVHCRGLCAECCGPVPAALGEVTMMERRAGRPHGYLLDNGHCTFLNAQKRCDVYRDRPAVCRAFGAVKTLACPFGCEPSRWISDREMWQILEAITQIAGESVQPLPYMRDGRRATSAELQAVVARGEALIARGFRPPAEWDLDQPHLVCGSCLWRAQATDGDNAKFVGEVCGRCGAGTLRIALDDDPALFVTRGR